MILKQLICLIDQFYSNLIILVGGIISSWLI